MPIDTQKAARKLEQRLKASGLRHLRQRLNWLHPYPIGIRIDANLAIQRRDWPVLLRQARKYRRDALRDLRGMSSQQLEWAELWDGAERVRDVVKMQRKPVELPEWPTVRASVLAKLREKGFSQAQAQRGLATFTKVTWKEMLKSVDRLFDEWGQQLEFGATSRFSALAVADIAEVVAQFNMIYEKRGPRHRPAQNTISRAHTEIYGLLRGLRVALRNPRRSGVLAKARRTEARAARLLTPLLTAAAYWAVPNVGEYGAAYDAAAGRKATEVADTIRVALFARSVARVVAWKAGWPEGSSFLGSWRKAAKSKSSFESAFHAPRVTSLGDIASQPQRFNEKYISIEGRVGPVTIIHRRRKVVCSTSLSDASGAVVPVGLSHIKLDSGGLVPGSYAQITGTYTTRHEDFRTPILIPDRRNLTEDSRRSWLDWLALELLPIFTPTPHNLCVRWSWSPGSDGPGNLLRHGTWASFSRGVL